MKKNLIIIFNLVIACLIFTGCSAIKKESVFDCFDNTGKTDSVTLTYTEDSHGIRKFYDGDKKIGDRSDAIDYASEKTGGMICHSGSDRKN